MARLFKDKLGCDGVSVLQNNGAFSDLGHSYLHVFPRHVDDGFGWVSAHKGGDGEDALARVRSILVDVCEGHGPSLRTDSPL